MFSILIIINREAVLPQGHIHNRCIISEKCISQLKTHMLLSLNHRPCKLMVYLGHFLPLFSISFLLYIIPI